MIRLPALTAHGRGRPVAQLAESQRYAAIIGDSLTSHDYACTPIYWQLGLAGAPTRLLANCGAGGQTIDGCAGQIDRDYRIEYPGFSGLPPLKLGIIRIGTNDSRGGSAIDNARKASYRTLLTRALTYAEHVLFLPVPPEGEGITVAINTQVAGYNAFLQELVAEDPTRRHYLDDCADLVDGGGAVITSYYDSDMLHINGAGSYRMALTSEGAFAALLASLGFTAGSYSPLVTDPAIVYPTYPQWHPNPTNVGTGGTKGSGWSGSVIDGGLLEFYGSGGSGTASIVAADGGDPIQIPWQRMAPTVASSGGGFGLSFTGAGRTITGSDPDTLEQVLEVRFNDFKAYDQMVSRLFPTGGGTITPSQYLRWSGSTGANRRATHYQKFARINAGGTGATSIVRLEFGGAASGYSGAMGSVDVRCHTVRG